jgi:hypothetical protein
MINKRGLINCVTQSSHYVLAKLRTSRATNEAPPLRGEMRKRASSGLVTTSIRTMTTYDTILSPYELPCHYCETPALLTLRQVSNVDVQFI